MFRDYLRLLVEFSGMHADDRMPEDPVEASYLIGDALQVADSMKQRLLELSSTEQRLSVELGFLRRLLPQLKSLLERKRDEARRLNRRPRRAMPIAASRKSSSESSSARTSAFSRDDDVAK